MRILFKSIVILLLSLSSAASAFADKKVELFVTSWCPYCVKMEQDLRRRNVNFDRYDVEKDPRGAELFSEIGGAGVPMARVGSTIVRGYDPEGVIRALQAG